MLLMSWVSLFVYALSCCYQRISLSFANRKKKESLCLCSSIHLFTPFLFVILVFVQAFFVRHSRFVHSLSVRQILSCYFCSSHCFHSASLTTKLSVSFPLFCHCIVYESLPREYINNDL